MDQHSGRLQDAFLMFADNSPLDMFPSIATLYIVYWWAYLNPRGHLVVTRSGVVQPVSPPDRYVSFLTQDVMDAEVDAGVREYDVNVAEHASGHVSDGDLDGLEHRARMLLGETAPPDRHYTPNIAGRLHSICDLEESCVRCQQQQPDYPTWNTELYRYHASPTVAGGSRTCSGMAVPMFARHGSRPRNTMDTLSTGGQLDAKCSLACEQETTWPAALATLLAQTDSSSGFAERVRNPGASASPLALQKSEPCQLAQSFGCSISAKSALAGDAPLRAIREARSLEGVPAHTHGVEWVKSLKEFVDVEFVEDPVVQALFQRADDINVELMKRCPTHV